MFEDLRGRNFRHPCKSAVNVVSGFKYLGVHLAVNHTGSQNTYFLVKKGRRASACFCMLYLGDQSRTFSTNVRWTVLCSYI